MTLVEGPASRPSKVVWGRPPSPVQACVGTAALARPSRAKLGSCLWPQQLWVRYNVTLAAPPTRAHSCLRRTTIQAVKTYRIQRIKGGMNFTCTQCAHSVSTLDFDAKAGNLRTQAATVINAHATQAHHAPLIISPSDSQQRTWR